MTKTLRKLELKVHKHTTLAMIECADHGRGCDVARAVRSATELIDYIESLLKQAISGERLP